MTELLTAAQMRAIEKAAIESGEVTGLELMERAGRGVVEAAVRLHEERKGPKTAVVLCGPGNNGGDGFVIARRLKDMGWKVELFFFGEAKKLPPDARRMHDLWSETGDIFPMEPELAGQGERPGLMFDAMFGTGLTRPIPLICAQVFHAVSNREVTRAAHPWHVGFNVIAVDCPSGMDCDSGEFLTPEIAPNTEEGDTHCRHWETEIAPRLLRCNLCVTFHRAKVGHYVTEIGYEHRPEVVDIGLPDGENLTDVARTLMSFRDREIVRLICPPADQRAGTLKAWLTHAAMGHIRGGHKYERGHALILGGGTGKGGAARLAARAALRVGAGLATLGVPHEALAENAAQLNAIMLREIGDSMALAKVLEDERIAALCLGPGLGVGEETRALVRAALEASVISEGHDKRRYVLDADALTSFVEDPKELFSILHENCILTPHEGEFARLFPDLSEKERAKMRSEPPVSKVEAVRHAAWRAGCTILLKGPATVIASPDGTASIHAALYDRRADWLGTAGGGDVLAGMITGLMANGMAGFYIHQIVEVAAYLHVEAARSYGPGLIAEDLPEELPKVFRTLGM